MWMDVSGRLALAFVLSISSDVFRPAYMFYPCSCLWAPRSHIYMQSLSASLLAFYGDFLTRLDDEEALSALVIRYEKIGRAVEQRKLHQQLDPATKQRAWTVAHNVLRAGEAVQQLTGHADTAIAQLHEDLSSLSLTTTARKHVWYSTHSFRLT
jgi:hypothetical protein